MRKRIQVLTGILLLALLTGCADAAKGEAVTSTSPPAETAVQAIQSEAPISGKTSLPTPPSTSPDKNGYAEFAQRFFAVLKQGDAFAASSYIWFTDEQARDLWMERYTAPHKPSLTVSRVSMNLWAATVEEDYGAEAPPTTTVYYVAWYDGSYRIFTDPLALPADLLRDQDYSAMPLPEEKPSQNGGRTPGGEDEFPPEEGQAESWYRSQQQELAAVRAAAEKAVRALPEAKTVTSFDEPEIELVDASTVSFLEAEPKGSQLLLYVVRYPTTADAVLGPISVYLDSEANVLGFGPRE